VRSVDVVGAAGEDEVVVTFFAEGGTEVHVEFVRFARGGVGLGVVAEGVARFDAVHEGAKNFVEVGDVGDVKDFAAGLVDDFANVDEAGNHGSREESARRIVSGNFQVVENGLGGDGFGYDVARTLAPGIGADVVADENDNAAMHGRGVEEIFRSNKDAVVNVGGTADWRGVDGLGDLGLVLGEWYAELGFGREGEEGDFVFGLERREGGVGGFVERPKERADGITQIEDQSDIQREFIAIKDFDCLRDAVFAEFEVILFKVGHDLTGFGFHGGVDEDELDVDANDRGLVLRLRRSSKHEQSQNDKE
jgi:hypothetical protein